MLFLFPALLHAQTEVKVGDRRKLGNIQSPIISESSGLAVSRQYPGKYWTHNDNGLHPGLFLIDTDGTLRAHLTLHDVPFRDWEDMASVRLDGVNYLVLGDVGDNGSRRETCCIYLVQEPVLEFEDTAEQPIEETVSPDAVIEFAYPDGPCDCEAIMVDATDKKIFTVSKSMDAEATENLSMIHWVPLQTASTERPILATRLQSPFNKHLISGAQISPDGKLAVIRSYTAAWIFCCAADQTWLEVFAAGQPARRTMLPLQRQGEAICFGRESGSLLLTSEGEKQTIWQIDLQSAGNDR